VGVAITSRIIACHVLTTCFAASTSPRCSTPSRNRASQIGLAALFVAPGYFALTF
jgi:hypothetical protein